MGQARPGKLTGKTAFVTGASSGIGAATALALAHEGAGLVLGARRSDRVQSVALQARAEGAAFALALDLDVKDAGSIEAFCQAGLAHAGGAHILINNAGGARGLDPVASGHDADWTEMFDSNVLGVLRMTRALIPALIASGDGHIVFLGSIAGHQAYEGGAAYCGSKAAVRSIRAALRLELCGQPVRVSSVDPGMTETEFSRARFHGDDARAATVYQGVTPLQAMDIADVIQFTVTRPAHVNVDEVLVTPRDQASVYKTHRH